MPCCQICGKPLTDPVSVNLGIGPVCRLTIKDKDARDMTGNLFNDRASYGVAIIDGVICITDHDSGRTVTNDAANVIADLARDGIPLATHPVIYRDTMGVWDELDAVGGTFNGFVSLNETDLTAAIRKALARRAGN